MQDQMVQQETTVETEMLSTPLDLSMMDPMMQEDTQGGSRQRADNSLTAGLAAAFDEEGGGGPSGRLSGPGAVLFAQLVGDDWQVKTAKEGMTMDRAHIVKAEEKAEGADPPTFYKPGAANSIGEFGQRGNHATRFTASSWVGYNGVVTCKGFKNDKVVYFVIDYTAPRPYTPKEQQESTFLEKDGSAGMRYFLYKLSLIHI